jgi:GNAT superfamily N-acetyltransferase
MIGLGHTLTVDVRRAEPSDADEVARVHVRSWQVAYRGLLADDYLDGLRPEDRAARYQFGRRDQHAPLTLIATDAGTITGFATIGPATDVDVDGAGELLALYVDPPLWGSGIGRTLVSAARHRLVETGHAAAVLWVLVGNERARRFYEVDGWMPDGARRDYQVWRTIANEVRYRPLLP